MVFSGLPRFPNSLLANSSGYRSWQLFWVQRLRSDWLEAHVSDSSFCARHTHAATHYLLSLFFSSMFLSRGSNGRYAVDSLRCCLDTSGMSVAVRRPMFSAHNRGLILWNLVFETATASKHLQSRSSIGRPQRSSTCYDGFQCRPKIQKPGSLSLTNFADRESILRMGLETDPGNRYTIKKISYPFHRPCLDFDYTDLWQLPFLRRQASNSDNLHSQVCGDIQAGE